MGPASENAGYEYGELPRIPKGRSFNGSSVRERRLWLDRQSLNSTGRNRSSAILQRLFYQGVVSETGVAKEASQG